jgi:hypothetical protein
VDYLSTAQDFFPSPLVATRAYGLLTKGSSSYPPSGGTEKEILVKGVSIHSL